MARRLLDDKAMAAVKSARARTRTRTGRRGFTLVELAVVVAIVGILSVLAVVGYRKLILSSKVTEAQNVISAIRVAEESYRAERGTYVDIGSSKFCPSDGSKQAKTAWDPSCNGGTTTWAQLPVHVDGPVQFGYRVFAGSTGFSAPTDITWVDWSGASTTVPWYVVHAKADLNDDGSSGLYTELVGTSFQNTIFSRNEGQ